MTRLWTGTLLALTTLLLGSCDSLHERSWKPEPYSFPPARRIDLPPPATVPAPEPTLSPLKGGVIQQGSGVFVRPVSASPRRSKAGSEGGVTLNFEDADLSEVSGFILGELLQHNYVIDPRVKGKVTLHTSDPVHQDDLLTVLESLLQMNSAALVASSGLYQVVPLGSALLAAPDARLGTRSEDAGFRVQIVPLRYIAAQDMVKLLKPITPKEVSLNVNLARNLLTIAAPHKNLVQLLDMVRMFDVDWLQGLSVGLYPLQNASPQTVIAELKRILYQPDAGGLEGVLSFEPIERLNAILVLSKQPRYLQRTSALIEQLDQGDFAQSRQLRIYPIRNGKAEYFADLLKQLFVADEAQASRQPLRLEELTELAAAGVAPDVVAQAASVPPLTVIGENRDPVTIIPDPASNNLLVMASANDHRTVAAALEKMEIRPRQVLIEATIAEISLTDSLAYGLQWFLRHDVGRYDGNASFGDFSGLGGGFSATLSSAGDLRLLFDALASNSKLKILSSPQLLVIDNQSGSIRVGDSIPIVSRQSQGVENLNAPISQEIEYRDTGVLLQVVPHIHASGLVRLEVSIEISQPGPDTFAGGNVSFIQRTIDSSVVVQSGETVVLGGLILENETYGESGVPWLSKVPVIGKLFSRTADDGRRTELMVTLTPRVIETQADAQAATDELRLRLKGLFQDGYLSAPPADKVPLSGRAPALEPLPGNAPATAHNPS